MRVLISGGGTGGHVYPALAVVEQLKRVNQRQEVAQNEAQAKDAPKQRSDQQPQSLALQENQQSRQEQEAVRGKLEQESVPQERAAQDEVKAAVEGLASPHSTQDYLPTANLLWIGAETGMEQALVEREGIPFAAIETGQIRGVNPIKSIANLIRMVRGFAQSRVLVRQFKPDVCFVTGGYVCVPVAIACRMLRIPILVYLPDMSPGGAIQIVSYLAQRVAVTFEDVATHFGGLYPKGKAVVTGYPVREALVKASLDRPKARLKLMDSLQQTWRQQLTDTVDDTPKAETASIDSHILQRMAGFQPTGLPLTLIWGGSQGARSINRATWAHLSEILEVSVLVHVVGLRDWPMFLAEQLPTIGKQLESEQPAELLQRYYPVAYLHEEMTFALAAADLTVSRAGASTLGEFPVARLPSILVPLPYRGVAQGPNAELLVNRGGAFMIRDEMLSVALAPTIRDLLEDASLRKQMEQSLVATAVPDAASNIAHELAELAGKQKY